MSLRRIAPLFVIVLASGLIAAGCGGDDNGDDSTSVPNITLPTITDATSAEDAKQQATEAVNSAKSQAYDACINAVEQVPAAQQDAARTACQKLQQ